MSERERITVTVKGDVAIVRFKDLKIVDNANIEQMGEELFSIIDDDKIRHMLLNFDGVQFLSSATLNKFIMLDKKIKEVGGVLRLCCLKPEIREVFTLTRLDRVFDIRETEADALKAFGLDSSD